MSRGFANVDSARLGTSANLASTTSSSTSSAFGAQTYMVRVMATAAVNIRFGQPAQGPYTVTTPTSWASTFGGQATFTVTASHTLGVGQTVTVASVTPSGYNGTYTTMAGTTGTVVKVPLASDPGAYVSGGTITGQSAPVAVATDSLIPANARPEYFIVSPGQVLASIGTGTVNITEITQ